jgi:hypothetical protein
MGNRFVRDMRISTKQQGVHAHMLPPLTEYLSVVLVL